MSRLPIDRNLALSGLSGLLLALSFPRIDASFLAWFALIPLFLVMHRRPFVCGFVAGAGFFGPVLYWLNIVMTTYGKMHPFFSVAAYLILICYLSLFFGTAIWAACRLREKLGFSPVLTLPVVWTALEFVRAFLLSGFPWATLGYSQSDLPLIQSVDLFGVYGLSFLVVLVNVALAETVRALWRRKFEDIPRTALAAATLLFAMNLGYGYFRLGQDLDGREEKLEVALIQGNIDQAEKWDPARRHSTVRLYNKLSLSASQKGKTDLIIWPESATPFYFQEGGALGREVVSTALSSGAYLLFGSPAYEMINRTPSYLNSSFLLSAQGNVLGRSDKVHLVPFGEYVPFGRFFPFIDKLVAGIGDFSPGTVSPLPMNGHQAGVLICFEGIFPELARDYVRRGSDLLVNITNDAWFGRSSAPDQHLAMTRFRAIENRVWVARAANTGISAFIAPSGEITARTPVFETLFLRGSVGLGATPTLYTRIGDVIPGFFILLSLWWFFLARDRKKSF